MLPPAWINNVGIRGEDVRPFISSVDDPSNIPSGDAGDWSGSGISARLNELGPEEAKQGGSRTSEFSLLRQCRAKFFSSWGRSARTGDLLRWGQCTPPPTCRTSVETNFKDESDKWRFQFWRTRKGRPVSLFSGYLRSNKPRWCWRMYKSHEPWT